MVAMSFLPPRPLAARWRPVGADGLEHLDLRYEDGTIVADSVVIGNRGGVPYGLRYLIVCGEDWVVRSLNIATTDGRSLHLRSDGEGRLYRYEAVDRSFTADLTVDEDGLVTEYPGLFVRVGD
jgi:hypothetical protein